jgi:hypothetical protein
VRISGAGADLSRGSNGLPKTYTFQANFHARPFCIRHGLTHNPIHLSSGHWSPLFFGVSICAKQQVSLALSSFPVLSLRNPNRQSPPASCHLKNLCRHCLTSILCSMTRRWSMRNAIIRIAAVLVHIALLGIAYYLIDRIIDRLLDLRYRRCRRLPPAGVLPPLGLELAHPK